MFAMKLSFSSGTVYRIDFILSINTFLKVVYWEQSKRRRASSSTPSLGQKKICVFPGRIIYKFFEIILLSWSTFYKNRTGIERFRITSRSPCWCPLYSRILITFYCLVHQHARTLQKQIVSNLSFNITCNRNRLEIENFFFAKRINCKKRKTTIKKLGSVTWT